MGRPSRSEQMYSAMKQVVLETVTRPGQHVDIEGLANRFGVSTQPVRLLLNRMVGEHILQVHPREGYVIPSATERRVRHVHRWNQQVLLLALETAMDGKAGLEFPELRLEADHSVEAIEALFTAIARLSDNDETERAVRNLNDRLRPIRCLDVQQLLDVAGELETFDAAWRARDLVGLHRLVWQYHHRRLEVLPQILILAYDAAAQN